MIPDNLWQEVGGGGVRGDFWSHAPPTLTWTKVGFEISKKVPELSKRGPKVPPCTDTYMHLE